MRSTTMLAVAALCVAGCKGPAISLGPMCFDGCGGGYYDGPIITTTIIGFPTSRVDTVGPRTIGGFYYGRLQVGDSLTLHVVRHVLSADPCAAPDTLRTVTWAAFDSTVLQPRDDTNGRGVVRAVASGESMIVATAPTAGAATTIWTCNGTRSAHYVAMIKVDPKSP